MVAYSKIDDQKFSKKFKNFLKIYRLCYFMSRTRKIDYNKKKMPETNCSNRKRN